MLPWVFACFPCQAVRCNSRAMSSEEGVCLISTGGRLSLILANSWISDRLSQKANGLTSCALLRQSALPPWSKQSACIQIMCLSDVVKILWKWRFSVIQVQPHWSCCGESSRQRIHNKAGPMRTLHAVSFAKELRSMGGSCIIHEGGGDVGSVYNSFAEVQGCFKYSIICIGLWWQWTWAGLQADIIYYYLLKTLNIQEILHTN